MRTGKFSKQKLVNSMQAASICSARKSSSASSSTQSERKTKTMSDEKQEQRDVTDLAISMSIEDNPNLIAKAEHYYESKATPPEALHKNSRTDVLRTKSKSNGDI
jgi:hypothetical protein